jgi:hypothetical protein
MAMCLALLWQMAEKTQLMKLPETLQGRPQQVSAKVLDASL